ncbi:kinase-like protein, partial [Punctularia strigosozonata HHB-11173 SS5]
SALRELRSLCGETGLLPTSYELSGLVKSDDEEPCSSGGFSDVWRGEHNGVPVALKVLRLHAGDRAKYKQVFCKEAVVWRRLSHRNIVPFLGVSPRHHLCIVSEWMEHGDVMSYLERFPQANRLQLITDVARGLEYMHAVGVIHGDMKGRNVLVDSSHRARLSDFGLAMTALGTHSLALSSGASSNWGTLRYMAPELSDPRMEIKVLTTKTDVYGFGMTAWEMYDGRMPFYHVRGDYTVVLKVQEGVRPSRPLHARELGLDDYLWALIEACWHAEPSLRPSVSTL